ncbi:hypothetical protein [Sphingomonas jeddahensis]|uniref:Uncharacterized protein n=1 Tax=Sphingomonas jeddahensis TaxID=1915074 RepID=A0A1V2EXN8_9SPHN|nr:hypothetical protein [Sphingomonas jeddahensis]ONF97267.1 hypothetical protein SPHI_07040 [Sphingomonas jeddahensis]
MQRVRVGMVGLAAVVLLIGLASALFSAASREQPVAAAGAPRAEKTTNSTAANSVAPVSEDNEPLAKLGVAPSATETAPPSLAPPPQPPQTGGAQ